MIFQFDHYSLDTEKRTLTRRGVVVTLTPKVFQTLLVLVKNHERVMSKEELFTNIWPEQFVEESNLTQNISVLRKALEETASGKKYIVTFHGHGYRFLGEVSRNQNRVVDDTHPAVIDLKPVDTHNEIPVNTQAQPQIATTGGMAPGTQHRALQSEISSTPAINLVRRSPLLPTLLAAAVVLLCGSAFYGHRIWERHISAASNELREITTLTRLEGAQYEPSWSQDGSKLAFINSTPNAPRSSIYLLAKGELQPHQVISGDGEYSSPSWSPDGRFLAYIRTQKNVSEILILDLTQGTTRRLADLFPHRYGLDYRHLDWSPDGSFLAADDKKNETDPLSIYLVHVSNGEKFQLSYPTMDIIGDVAPRFSPDGTRVAFVRIKYQYQEDVFVLPVVGGEARRLTEQSIALGDVDWENNQGLVFSGRLGDEFRFWRQSLQVSPTHPTLASPIGEDMPVQFSVLRNSGKIAYSAYRSNLNIWSLNLDKRDPSAADWKPVIRTPGQDIAPSFSPDGTKIAFRSDLSGKVQMWVSNVDGSKASPVDTKTLIPAVNCWGSDSQSLIFKDMSDQGLYEVSVQPKNPMTRITGLHLSHPVSSADGRSIFAISSHFVYQLSRATGAIEKVTDQGGAPIAQSKDGRYLYFAQGRMEPTISQLDLQTKHQTVVISSLKPGYYDSWALTSKGILFLKEDHGEPTISFYDTVTHKERTIAGFDGNLPSVGLSGFSVSPDERSLLVVRAEPVFSNIQSVTLSAREH